MDLQKKQFKKFWKQRDSETKTQLSLVNNLITFEQISIEFYSDSLDSKLDEMVLNNPGIGNL